MSWNFHKSVNIIGSISYARMKLIANFWKPWHSSKEYTTSKKTIMRWNFAYIMVQCFRHVKKMKLSNLTNLSPRHFRRWGGLCAHTRKKKKLSNLMLLSFLVTKQQAVKQTLNFNNFWVVFYSLTHANDTKSAQIFTDNRILECPQHIEESDSLNTGSGHNTLTISNI